MFLIDHDKTNLYHSFVGTHNFPCHFWSVFWWQSTLWRPIGCRDSNWKYFVHTDAIIASAYRSDSLSIPLSVLDWVSMRKQVQLHRLLALTKQLYHLAFQKEHCQYISKVPAFQITSSSTTTIQVHTTVSVTPLLHVKILIDDMLCAFLAPSGP